MAKELKFYKKPGQSSKIQQLVKKREAMKKKLEDIERKIQNARHTPQKSHVNKITKIKLGNHDQPIPDSDDFDPQCSFLISGSETPLKEDPQDWFGDVDSIRL